MRLVFDTEANGLDDVTQMWCIATINVDTKGEKSFGPDRLQDGMLYLSQADELIGHNILWYDFFMMKKLHGFEYKGKATDTLILSRLSMPDRQLPFGFKPLPGKRVGAHSLEAWMYRLGGEQKIQHEDWSRFSPEMMARCESDARSNLRVYEAIYKEMME